MMPELDISSVLHLQPQLNPWLVVLIGSMAGLLAFALSHALYVLHVRHKRTVPVEGVLLARLRRVLMPTVIAVTLMLLAKSVSGPKLIDAKGWLSGEDLFTVLGRSGFLASYPNLDRSVEKEDIILELRRDAGPDELASARNRRALLQQDLEFTRLEALRIDPLLISEHSVANDQQRNAQERRQKAMENLDALKRNAPRQQLQDQSHRHEIERDLQTAKYELEQTQTSLNAAQKSLELANLPGKEGLIPGDDQARRHERVGVLKSRRDQLRERMALLVQEHDRMQTLTSQSEDTYAAQLKLRNEELAALDRQLEDAKAQVETTQHLIDIDKNRSELQRQNRIHQIELQISEIDELTNSRDGTLKVRAPWAGRVGFRESSPASVRSAARPLLILYQPGKVSVRLQIPADQSVDPDEKIVIELQTLLPEAAATRFSGQDFKTISHADGSSELAINVDPPEAAIRELGIGNSVPVHVVIRQANPLASSRYPWFWITMAASIGLALGELRYQRARQAAQRTGGEGNAESFLDWGGNPDEFLEFVAGVGIVSRKMRQFNPAEVDSANERRVPSDAPIIIDTRNNDRIIEGTRGG